MLTPGKEEDGGGGGSDRDARMGLAMVSFWPSSMKQEARRYSMSKNAPCSLARWAVNLEMSPFL